MEAKFELDIKSILHPPHVVLIKVHNIGTVVIFIVYNYRLSFISYIIVIG